MGPLWSGQGTVPHCTVSNLLSTDVLVSPPGALVGAAAWERDIHENISRHANTPCAVVLTVEETVLLIPALIYTATTLIVQLLPGAREELKNM